MKSHPIHVQQLLGGSEKTSSEWTFTSKYRAKPPVFRTLGFSHPRSHPFWSSIWHSAFACGLLHQCVSGFVRTREGPGDHGDVHETSTTQGNSCWFHLVDRGRYCNLPCRFLPSFYRDEPVVGRGSMRQDLNTWSVSDLASHEISCDLSNPLFPRSIDRTMRMSTPDSSTRSP